MTSQSSGSPEELELLDEELELLDDELELLDEEELELLDEELELLDEELELLEDELELLEEPFVGVDSLTQANKVTFKQASIASRITVRTREDLSRDIIVNTYSMSIRLIQ